MLGAGQVVGGIHRAENVVGGHLVVERGDQAREALFANLRRRSHLLKSSINPQSESRILKSLPSYDQRMDDAPKSAIELAMARFKKQDADAGVTDRVLTDEQKNEIAEVRKTYGAKLAQEEILFKSKRQASDRIPIRARRSRTTIGATSSGSITSGNGRSRRSAALNGCRNRAHR